MDWRLYLNNHDKHQISNMQNEYKQEQQSKKLMLLIKA